MMNLDSRPLNGANAGATFDIQTQLLCPGIQGTLGLYVHLAILFIYHKNRTLCVQEPKNDVNNNNKIAGKSKAQRVETVSVKKREKLKKTRK